MAIDPSARTARRASRQFGVIAREQALAEGLTDKQVYRLVVSGAWRRVLPGVYRVASSPTSWMQMVMAACLWSKGWASHCCAAAVWGLDGFQPKGIEVLVTRDLKVQGGVTVRRTRSLDPRDRSIKGPIRVTSPARTLLDVCGTVGIDAAEVALESALRRGLATPESLRRTLERCGGRGVPGTKPLRQLVAERPVGYRPMRSPLEVKVRRIMLRARLPRPTYEHPVVTGTGVTLHPDLCYPSWKIAIEVQSYRYHSGVDPWGRDIDRRQLLQDMGWLVIEVTERMIREEPEVFIARVKRAIAERQKATAI